VTAEANRFEIVEHTADVAIRGRACDLPGLFRVMARGLFSVIAAVDAIRPERERAVTLSAATLPDLLHDWLEELNGLHQVHHEIYGTFEPEIREKTGGTALHATVRGEAIDLERHRLGSEVKAVTWHDLSLERSETGFEAYVLLDI
jgi:SHS2 domain-containing protein